MDLTHTLKSKTLLLCATKFVKINGGFCQNIKINKWNCVTIIITLVTYVSNKHVLLIKAIQKEQWWHLISDQIS